VRPSPAVTVETPSLFVTERSALVSMVFVSLAVLLPAFGSDVALATVAVFVAEPFALAGTV
jgi:hypothetical protein